MIKNEHSSASVIHLTRNIERTLGITLVKSFRIMREREERVGYKVLLNSLLFTLACSAQRSRVSPMDR